MSSTDSDSDTMDLRGLKCPLPALLVRRALAAKAPGAVVSVIADDPLAYIDVPHMCRQEGHEVLDCAREGDVSRMTVQRGTSRSPDSQ